MLPLSRLEIKQKNEILEFNKNQMLKLEKIALEKRERIKAGVQSGLVVVKKV